jgi:hypothetical protein
MESATESKPPTGAPRGRRGKGETVVQETTSARGDVGG